MAVFAEGVHVITGSQDLTAKIGAVSSGLWDQCSKWLTVSSCGAVETHHLPPAHLVQ